MKRQRASSKKRPEYISTIVNCVLKPVKLFFQDESRFGRISQSVSCWSPVGARPITPSQIVREYTYSYTAVSPLDGETVSLILPDMTTECLNVFLQELSLRYPENHIILVLDGAARHRGKERKIPENISLIQ